MAVPMSSGSQLKLLINDAVQPRAHISYKTRYQSQFGGSADSSRTVFYVVGRVDDHDSKRRQAAARDKHKRMRPQRSAAALQQTAAAQEDLRLSARSSPLAQTDRSRSPDAYQSTTLHRPSQTPLMPAPAESLFAWRQRLPSPGPSTEQQHTQRPATERGATQRKRPNNIAVREPTMDDVSDVTLLYPQMSPYADPTTLHRSYDTPPPIQRSISQPQTPTWRHSPVSPMHPEALPSLGFPRAPTYPPSTIRRHTNRYAGSQDAAFQDHHELQMFAEASVGLGPEDAFRSPVQERMERRRQPGRQPTRSDTLQTPTTVEALQQLASMPGGNMQQQDRQQQQQYRQRLGRSASGLDLWLTPPSGYGGSTSPQPLGMPDVSPIEEHSGDEELPDYVTSQAQAAAQNRQAATLRAQELQRRWRASTAAP